MKHKEPNNPEWLKDGESADNFHAGEEPTKQVAEAIVEITKAAPEKTTAAKVVNNSPIALSARGVATPQDFETAFRVANALWKGKGFPAWVKTPEQAFAVSQFCRSLNLDVMTGIQHVCEVNGRLSLWGEGPLAAVRASGKLKAIKEYLMDKEYKEICLANKNLDAPLYAAVCITWRKGSKEPKESWFTVEDEKHATQGIAAIWKGYRRIMFKRKARAENLKDNFGDVLLGAGVAEYDFEQAPDMPETQNREVISAAPSLAERMNQKALSEPKDVDAQAPIPN